MQTPQSCATTITINIKSSTGTIGCMSDAVIKVTGGRALAEVKWWWLCVVVVVVCGGGNYM